MNPQPDQTYLARTFEDDRYAWTRVRRVRRRLVAAEVGLLLALVVATLAMTLTDTGWSTPYAVAWAVGLLGFIPLHSCLNLGIRGVFDRSGRSLDEHQRRLRERSASAVAPLSTFLNLAAWLGAVVVVARTGHADLAAALGFLLWFVAMLAPYWHLSWTLPDEEQPLDADA